MMRRTSSGRSATDIHARHWLVPLGRVFFSSIFLLSVAGHFSASTIGYAASHGVPYANLLVPFSGALALLGGLSVILGFRTRWGAAALVLFLIPVTLMMHNFWAIGDAQEAMVQRAMFMKNLSMLGGALLIMYFGGGPLSLDARAERRHVGSTPFDAPASARKMIELESQLPAPL